MSKNFKYSIWMITAAIIVAVDLWLKNWALQNAPGEDEITLSLFDIAIHKNPGIAFNLDIGMPLILLFSSIIGFILLRIAYKQRTSHPGISAAALIIVIGAIGNLVDRISQGFTIDYIILFARTAINLSDLVIITGVILFLTKSHTRKKIDTSL